MKITTASSAARGKTLVMESAAGLLVIGIVFGACGVAPQSTAPSPAIAAPVASTTEPTAEPTATMAPAPTETPTVAPTVTPTAAPTAAPTTARTAMPVAALPSAPTTKAVPTVAPTIAPAAVATVAPTVAPAAAPVVAPRPVFLMPDESQAIGYLTKASGYELAVIPAANASRLATSFNRLDGAGTSFSGYSVRTVTKAGAPVALALVLSMCPCAAADPFVLDSFVNGMSDALGTDPLRETIAGQRAAYFEGSDGINQLVWVQGAEIVLLYGMNRGSMEQLAAALITANQ